jgi:hypothetical protein
MLHSKRKILLFVEPLLSFQFFIYNAQTKGYRVFIVSKNDHYLKKANTLLDKHLSFFQIDTDDEERLFPFIEGLVPEFNIVGVIPEYESHGVLAAKVSTFLKKPGLTPQVASALDHIEFIPPEGGGQSYYLDGLIKDNRVHILAISNRVISLDTENLSFGHTFQEDIDVDILNHLRNCLQRFVEEHNISCGAFRVMMVANKKEASITQFSMRFTDPFVVKVLYRAAGIDYYDKVFKLFTDQPLLFNGVSKRNEGAVYIKAYEIK